MAQSQKIPVEKVTKPIQLLAAWLTGLVLVNGMFLTAAKSIVEPTWIAGTLIIASIINVPIFLAAIFLLQTKFRPEMQEDSFYSKYLESKTGRTKQLDNKEQVSILKNYISNSNEKTIEIVSGLQAEIKKISAREMPNNNDMLRQLNLEEIDRKIEEASTSSIWNKYDIQVNKQLQDYEKFKKALSKNNIPIHRIFGHEIAGLVDPPQILIGSGFELEHIKQFIYAIKHIPITLVGYCYPEDVDNYHQAILLGAYFDNEGMSIDEFLELLENEEHVGEFYRKLMNK